MPEVLVRPCSNQAKKKEFLELGLVCSLKKFVIRIRTHEKQRGSGSDVVHEFLCEVKKVSHVLQLPA